MCMRFPLMAIRDVRSTSTSFAAVLDREMMQIATHVVNAVQLGSGVAGQQESECITCCSVSVPQPERRAVGFQVSHDV